VLADGRLLVAGGLQVSGTNVNVLNGAELYDPASGAWTNAAPLATGRAAHTATPLANGVVLVVGGEAQSGAALASAELYDPNTNHWTAAAPLHTARFGQAAVLLNGGSKVLVVGGRASSGGASTPLASTEVYDAATNSWTAGPNLTVARSDLTATLLADGRVLVAGGDAAASTSPASPQAVADLVDPDGRAVTRAANMSTVRADHTATLLSDGRVLVVGGTLDKPQAEVFAPGTGRWTATAPPSAARRYHAAVTLPSGKVLVAGGAGTAALASAETFDPSTNAWSAAPAMSGPRWQPVMAALKNGQVIVTGGVPVLARTTPPVATAEVYG
ncbi:MAG TPA: kelch repeat-containing protein, partial [Candidatus Dormibacteraeota bacterium]|nr:kelch repeat-containing protein [Candidatus Dormibacteraeota bacterium]